MSHRPSESLPRSPERRFSAATGVQHARHLNQIEENRPHHLRGGRVRPLQAREQHVVAGAVRLRVQRVVLEAVALLVGAHFGRAQVVRPAAAVHRGLGAQIGVRAGNVAGAAPLGARYDAAEQRQRRLQRRRFSGGGGGGGGRCDARPGRRHAKAGVVDVVPNGRVSRCGGDGARLAVLVLALDDLALLHQLDHLFELDLERPIDVAQLVQHVLAVFVVAAHVAEGEREWG